MVSGQLSVRCPVSCATEVAMLGTVCMVQWCQQQSVLGVTPGPAIPAMVLCLSGGPCGGVGTDDHPSDKKCQQGHWPHFLGFSCLISPPAPLCLWTFYLLLLSIRQHPSH